MDHAKAKISITLSPDVIREVDRAVERGHGPNRSSVIEQWLRQGARRDREAELRAETIAYYEALTDRGRREAAEVAEASAARASRLRFDED
jgi:metal-responsive CopG/Arc/MetJ family transcriptional regulator